jgi:hypothetical protein
LSDPAPVEITVNPVNDAPTANAGSATTDEDTAVTITLTGTDIDGDTLSFEVGQRPEQRQRGDQRIERDLYAECQLSRPGQLHVRGEGSLWAR